LLSPGDTLQDFKDNFTEMHTNASNALRAAILPVELVTSTDAEENDSSSGYDTSVDKPGGTGRKGKLRAAKNKDPKSAILKKDLSNAQAATKRSHIQNQTHIRTHIRTILSTNITTNTQPNSYILYVRRMGAGLTASVKKAAKLENSAVKLAAKVSEEEMRSKR